MWFACGVRCCLGWVWGNLFTFRMLRTFRSSACNMTRFLFSNPWHTSLFHWTRSTAYMRQKKIASCIVYHFKIACPCHHHYAGFCMEGHNCLWLWWPLWSWIETWKCYASIFMFCPCALKSHLKLWWSPRWRVSSLDILLMVFKKCVVWVKVL